MCHSLQWAAAPVNLIVGFCGGWVVGCACSALTGTSVLQLGDIIWTCRACVVPSRIPHGLKPEERVRLGRDYVQACVALPVLPRAQSLADVGSGRRACAGWCHRVLVGRWATHRHCAPGLHRNVCAVNHNCARKRGTTPCKGIPHQRVSLIDTNKRRCLCRQTSPRQGF
jgi:hypothetical protein